MSKLEQYILIFLGFFIFAVLFVRIGFFIGGTINPSTLIIILLTYFGSLIILYASNIFHFKETFGRYIPVIIFGITVFLLGGVSLFLSNTYDTSWDGQGYHQSAVIALSSNWNPALDPSIDFTQELPSQIFAEGYPSALWELEATVYSVTNRINSAKVFNIAIAMIAALMVYSLLRKLKFSIILSSIISLLITLQPVYLIQVLTFMEDGFGYELLVIAAASLAIMASSRKDYWAIFSFIMAELFLVTTKYSHLPLSVILGGLFALIIINRIMNGDYRINKITISLFGLFIFASLVFFSLPYLRNQFHHNAMFYPTNIPELMGSVRYNNVPNNLQDSDKFTLLFYGIFSKAQSRESGDPRSEANVAQLKFPFIFTPTEVTDSAELYNNRVGGAGPLFSGVVVLSILLTIFLYFKMETVKQRYAIYASLFGLLIILLLSLVAPTPNLLRYTNQLQLIPFALIIPIYAVFNKPYIKMVCYIIIALSAVNVFLFSTSVVTKTIAEHNLINQQMEELRSSGKEYQVSAQQFYSSYLLLKEQSIKFTPVNSLTCGNIKRLVTSSTTTQYCSN